MIKPILFNSDMVRAILEGRKTVTRRVVKLPKWIEKQDNGSYTLFAEGTCYEKQCFEEIATYLNRPCRHGDILYVRETWNICNMDIEDNTITFVYRADKSEEQSARTVKVSDRLWDKLEHTMSERNPEWRPSLHMPKEAARIFLKVTAVRVERLQEITEEQTEAEGFQFTPPCLSKASEDSYCDLDGPCTNKIKYCDMSAGELFGKVLWDSTIKKSELDTYGWDANPWVWVIEFERCEKPDEFTGSNN